MKTTHAVSLRQVARLAEVSPMTVSLALRNQPGVGPDTRKRIVRIAQKLGYSPDARVENWMACVRQAGTKGLLPIVWMNTSRERDTYHRYLFQSPYLRGARARANELGYEIDEVWCYEPGMTQRRLNTILHQRRIEGVIVTHPARHLLLEWASFASVSLGSSMLAPRLHQVTADFCFNMQLALRNLRRLGHQRIGICLSAELVSYSNFTLGATAEAFFRSEPVETRVPPLIHTHFMLMLKKSDDGEAQRAREFLAWVRRYKPNVIVCYDNRILAWLEDAGYNVPGDISVVHLAVDDDVLEWAGIHSRRSDTGAAAVDQLVNQMRNRAFGVPEVPVTISIHGKWQNGRTLAVAPRTSPSLR
jgi:LacI family transcriptional regulator